MSDRAVPLAKLSLVLSPKRRPAGGKSHGANAVFLIWGGGILFAALIYFGVPAFFRLENM